MPVEWVYVLAVINGVRLIKSRYAIDNDVIIENKSPNNVDGLRFLPLHQTGLRKIRIWTQNEQVCHRFYILLEQNHHVGCIPGSSFSRAGWFFQGKGIGKIIPKELLFDKPGSTG